jgi:orotate phosphoribosyltransferase
MDLSRPANKLAARKRAFEIVKEKSYAEGTFVLASGKTSHFYLDMKPTMFDPDGANLLAELVFDHLKQIPERIDLVGGVAMGAVPLVSAVTVLSGNKPKKLPGFVVRKQVKDHGTKKVIETSEALSGKNVVILEDVTTTGESSMYAVEAAQQAGATVVLVLSIVDREEGAAEFYKSKGIPFRWLFRLSEFRSGAASETDN